MTVAPTSFDGPSLARELLRARGLADIDAKLIEHVSREIGPAIVLEDDGDQVDAFHVTADTSDAAISAWMSGLAIGSAWVVPLRAPEGNRCGRLVVAPREPGERLDAKVEQIASDFAAARSRALRIDQLELALRSQEELVTKASDALVRDAKQVVRALSELERRNEETRAQLHQALRFQRAMLSRPPEHARASFETVYLPADVISGDFFDVTLVSEDTIRLFVADATGHGIAAGLATMFIKSDYDAHKRSQLEPAQILASMNDALATRYGHLELRFTAACIDVHLDQSMVRYSTAAHPGPLLAKAEETVGLPSGGPFVGLVPDVVFPTFETPIVAGDFLLCFTDGLTDATAADGSLFGEARLYDELTKARQEHGSVSRGLLRCLAEFVGQGRRLADDVTAVVLKIQR